MSSSGPVRTAISPTGSLRSSPPAASTTGVTIYSCGEDEAVLFRTLTPRFHVVTTITAAALSEATVDLALGSRCISVGHKTRVTKPMLLALSRAGVEYISTRSIGYDHIDVDYAESVGITVGNVAYSPDSVADHTLMLMLMAVRHVKSVVLRAEAHDYCLGETRGKELRDLTVGVVGTGRIGTAVIDRLRGFGSRVLAHGSRAEAPADHVALDELLRASDIVTLHAPLTADTLHLLDRHRIAQMKRGAFIVNAGRGPLVETDALLSALNSGRLGGAALDVLEGEEGIFYADCRDTPIDAGIARLQRLPNVIITAHTAYYTEHALADTVENSLINCRKYESGKQRAQAQRRNHLRRGLRRASRLREVRTGGRNEPRHRQVRAVLDRHHSRGGLEALRFPGRGLGRLPSGHAVTGQERPRAAGPGARVTRDDPPRRGLPGAARQAR